MSRQPAISSRRRAPASPASSPASGLYSEQLFGSRDQMLKRARRLFDPQGAGPVRGRSPRRCARHRAGITTDYARIEGTFRQHSLTTAARRPSASGCRPTCPTAPGVWCGVAHALRRRDCAAASGAGTAGVLSPRAFFTSIRRISRRSLAARRTQPVSWALSRRARDLRQLSSIRR